MKKSLSLLLSGAMVFGLFASAVSAAETTDLTPQQKFEELKAKGIFAGLADGSAGLDQEMTRAQAARIIALLKGLEGIGDPDTRVVTEKPFPDVDLGKWYTEEVDAVKEDGSFKGNADGTFNPNGNLSVQELAVAVAAALGFDAAAADPVEIEGAASWAGSSIKFLEDNGYVVPTNYTEPATRGQLVEATYVANNILNPVVPDKIGVAKAEATGAKKITVTLNGPVDKSKAEIAVKRDNSTAAVDSTDWSDDGKVVTITLTSKIIAATYTVTLSGIDNLDTEKATASFVGQVEKITSVEITTASDTLPDDDDVRVDFEAKNQYGEVSSLVASNFTITTGGSAPFTNVSGEQAILIDLDGKGKGAKVPLTVIHTDSGAQANKIFTVGEDAIVSKVEVGDLVDNENKVIESIQAGKVAYLDFKAYDQYGIRVSKLAQLNGPTGVTVVIPDNNLVKGDDPSDLTSTNSFVTNVVGDYADDLAISAINGATAKEITLSFFANGTGQSVQKVVRVSTPKVPASVEFGDFTSTLAVGDTNVKVPLIVKDAAGETLSGQDIADNADKFTVYAIGGVVTVENAATSIVSTGTHKGKLNITSVDMKGNGSIVIQLTNNPAAKATLNVSVVEQRAADRIAVATKAADKLLVIDGVGAATSGLKLKTFDQYNGDWKNATLNTSYVTLKVEKVSGADADAAVLDIGNVVGATTIADGDAAVSVTPSALFDKELIWRAQAGKSGTIRLTATFFDGKGTATATDDVELNKVTSTVTVYDGKSANLTYDVVLDGATDSTLYAAAKFNAGWNTPANAGKLSKSVKVSAKEGSATVALPSVIQSVTSSNPSVVDAVYSGGTVGLAKGEATLNVLFYTPNGVSSSTVNVKVSEDRPAVQSISVAEASAAGNTGTANASGYTGTIKVKDQYGTEFNQPDFVTGGTYANLLNVKFFISNVKHTSASSDDSVTINADTGDITYTNVGDAAYDVASFTINIIAPNGQTASTEVNF